jgi:SAM-dependent methyltransferase
MKGTAVSISEQSARFWEREWLWWHRLGTPLRPAAEDIEILGRLIAQGCGARGCRQPEAVLLGVTPEIASMQWPIGTRLLAIDRSQGMIDNVWPKQPFARATVISGEWTKMPMVAGSYDVATGDGCFSQLSYPEGYDALVQELRRILKPGGLFAMRAFVRPEPAESVEALLADLNAGKIRNFHVFKWRFNMALQSDIAAGVRLRDIWDAFTGEFGDPSALAAQRGWPFETVETIHAYREVDARYTYPTLSELREKLACFSEVACVYPTYEMADRCPTLLFEAG